MGVFSGGACAAEARSQRWRAALALSCMGRDESAARVHELKRKFSWLRRLVLIFSSHARSQVIDVRFAGNFAGMAADGNRRDFFDPFRLAKSS